MSKTKIFVLILLLSTCCLVTTPIQDAQAAVPIATIIKEGVKKVIKAIDLMIQRLQTKTIWLQNAQKTIENKLNQLKLSEIAQWTDKQRQQYKKYFDELWKIRNTLQTYQSIRQITERQVFLVQEYKRTWNMVNQDTPGTWSIRTSILTGWRLTICIEPIPELLTIASSIWNN